jgi:Flp pilus assembly protein TadG
MKHSRPRNSRRGSIILEFALAGIAVLTILPATVKLCIGLWNYHTLAYAVHEAARYAASHGRGCITGTSSCGITVGNVTTNLATNAIGLSSSALSVTLTTDSGVSTVCAPITTCTSSTTRWPPTSNMDNLTGKKVIVSATYKFTAGVLMSWTGAGSMDYDTFFFPAQATATIIF